MTLKRKDFYGREVADAIKEACEELGVPQEQLEIEVVETGSTGIFGLIRKKAHISVQVKEVETEVAVPIVEEKEVEIPAAQAQPQPRQSREKKKPAVVVEPPQPQPQPPADDSDDEDEETEIEDDAGEELPESALQLITKETHRILELMGYPSTVAVNAVKSQVTCKVGKEHEEALTGQEGKTLDAIQYILRKIVARQIPSRLRLSVDVGNYRENRLADLKVKALELALIVKADGKTQVIAALSPSERRVIHMSLQEDKEIRSRSVGDGLFKKILIYKPGKGTKGNGRRRSSTRGRKGNPNRKKSE